MRSRENTKSDRHGNHDQVHLVEAVPQRQHSFVLLRLILYFMNHRVSFACVCSPAYGVSSLTRLPSSPSLLPPRPPAPSHCPMPPGPFCIGDTRTCSANGAAFRTASGVRGGGGGNKARDGEISRTRPRGRAGRYKCWARERVDYHVGDAQDLARRVTQQLKSTVKQAREDSAHTSPGYMFEHCSFTLGLFSKMRSTVVPAPAAMDWQVSPKATT